MVKEGVDGSSPSEGSVKAPHVGAFVFRSTCRFSRVRWVWSRSWSFRVGNALVDGFVRATSHRDCGGDEDHDVLHLKMLASPTTTTTRATNLRVQSVVTSL
jgi:hypothetical protein